MRATSKDVAVKAGVSRSTVSLVLNEVPNARIPDETKAKVLQAAAELNYQPNQLAQGLKNNRSKTIAFLLPSISNPFYPYVAQGIEDVALENGYTVFICNTYREKTKEENYLKVLLQRQVDGVILSTSFNTTDYIKQFIEQGIAVTVFNRAVDLPGVDQVLVDNTYGGWLATKHLLELGHRRIAFLAGTLPYSSRTERMDGYKKALQEYGVKVDENLILRGESEQEYRDQSFDLYNGYTLTQKMLGKFKDVTAVIGINDLTIMGAFRALREAKIRIPEDISLVGYDDIAMSAMMDPPLTTVEQPKYERGKAAAELLIRRIKNPEMGERQSILFRPSLILRESTQKVLV